MQPIDAQLRSIVENIGAIVRRDGGQLTFHAYEPTTQELTVAFASAPDEECTDCTIDSTTVRMFLEEAVRAQGIPLESLQIQNP